MVSSRAAIAMAVVVLVGCGGGGGGSQPPSGHEPSGQDQPAEKSTVGVRAVVSGGSWSATSATATLSQSGSVLHAINLSIANGEATGSFPAVVLGDYTVRVEVFHNETLIASGESEVSAITQDPTAAAVTLSFLKSQFDVVIDVSADPTVLNGVYEGEKKVTAVCAAPTFAVSASETTINISGATINLKQDAFFDGVCLFTGTITSATDSIAAQGTVQCSNFDRGTWSGTLWRTGDDSFVGSIDIDIPSRACQYNARYIGFK